MAIYEIDGTMLNSAYNVSGSSLTYAYNKDGLQIYPYNPQLTLLNTMLMSSLNPNINITPQGMAVYGNYIFQFFTGDNTMRIFNKTTYELLGSYTAIDIKHANTMQFGAEVQDNGFPLLYVSEWGVDGATNSSTIDVLKAGVLSYQIVDSFTLPSSAGYHPSFVGDWGNGVGYSVGFKNSTSTTTSQPNTITKYDLTDMSVIEQYDVSYMGVLNGWDYYDGNLIYCGNTWNGATAIFSFIDVTTHTVTPYTFAKTSNEEYEGYAVDGNNLLCSNWINDGTLKYRFYTMNLL